MDQGLRWERVYNVNGSEVHAAVIDVRNVPSGAVELTVRTSCKGKGGEIHHQTNEITLTDLSGGPQLENFMRSCSEWLQKLLWEQPRILMFLAQLEKEDGTYMNLTSSFNIRQPVTFIDPIIAELAGLPQVGTFHPPENIGISLPVYRAKLRFGKQAFETNVVAANVNMSCLIGSDLVIQAIGERTEFLYDLFLPDVIRAVFSAARSKERTVLILGSYSQGGRSQLEEIRTVLREMGFEGIIVDDFKDIHQQSLYEKTLMLGSLARFVVCDEIVASGHLIELKACADIGFVTAILRNEGKPVTWMNSDIAAERTYMKIFSYCDNQPLREQVREAVRWCQQKVTERADFYNQHYPWRNKHVQLAISDPR